MSPTTIQVPFVDLRAQHETLALEIERAVRQVFERGDFILGAAVEQFEAEFAALHDVRHAVGVGNGGDRDRARAAGATASGRATRSSPPPTRSSPP